MKKRKNISFLIISTNAIGDSYLSLSSINMIKETFPDSKIYLLFNREASQLLPFISVDKVFILKSKAIFSIIKLIIEIRKIHFDYSLTFFPGRINSILLSFSGSKIKAGFRNFKKVENWHNKAQKVYTNASVNKTEEWTPELNFLDRIKMVLKTIGVNSRKISKYNIIDFQKAKKKKELILIHPISMISNKSMSSIQLLRLIDFLMDRFSVEIIIIGGKELIPSSELFHNISKKKINIKFNESLRNIVQLIDSSKLFIAVDSFPIHIADSLNADFVGIFGPTNPNSVLVNFQKSIFFQVEDLKQINTEKFIKDIDHYLKNSNYL